MIDPVGLSLRLWLVADPWRYNKIPVAFVELDLVVLLLREAPGSLLLFSLAITALRWSCGGLRWCDEPVDGSTEGVNRWLFSGL